MKADQISRRICELFRAERKARGITQVELSESLGISQATLSKIENHETEPGVVVWLRFCAMFRLSADLPLDRAKYDQLLRSHGHARNRRIPVGEASRWTGSRR
jgi:transcriptional regulator with XRE-family HTH domain